MPSRKRRQSFQGLLPRLGRGVMATSAWAVRNPQPVILLGLLLSASWALWQYAQRAETFRIAQVALPVNSSLKPRQGLIGTNIWELDIHALADELKRQQPWLKEIRVIRQLPSTIRVVEVQRIPVAQVRLVGGWYPVDREGFVLPQASASPAERLVRIVGFEARGGTLKVGRDNEDERLRMALRVRERLRRAPGLLSRRVTEINVGDPEMIRFLMDDAIEVRCGSEAELTAQLERLQLALRTLAKQALTIQYIDVRFPEPVIGPHATLNR